MPDRHTKQSHRLIIPDYVLIQFDLLMISNVIPDRHTKQSLTQTNHTRLCINTIRSPYDKQCDTWPAYQAVTYTD